MFNLNWNILNWTKATVGQGSNWKCDTSKKILSNRLKDIEIYALKNHHSKIRQNAK